MALKQAFTASWKKSTQPRKQRKYLALAPLHHQQKLLHTHLSAELKKKYRRRAAPLRKGDKVKVARGEFRGKDGKVDHVFLKKTLVTIVGLDRIKMDGSKIPVRFHPSNLLITDLDLTDKRRKALLSKEKRGKVNHTSAVMATETKSTASVKPASPRGKA